MQDTRALTKYVAGMLLLAFVITAAFVTLANIGSGLREDGHVINVAGRQRMLCQQVAISVSDVVATAGTGGQGRARVVLDRALTRMKDEHGALRSGDIALGLPVPRADQRAADAARAVDQLLEPFLADARRVALTPIGPVPPAAEAALIRVRGAAAGPLLTALDDEVTAYDERNSARLDRLRVLVLLSGILVLSGGIAIVVPLGLSLRRDRARLVTALEAEQQGQERLRESAAFHDAVLAATPDLMYVLDLASSSTVWISPLLEHTLGYPHLDGFGSAASASLVHPDDLAQLQQANAAAGGLADGQVDATRYRVRHADGTWRMLARRATPFLRDATGRVTQLLAVATDVTDTADGEQKLRRAALHDALTGLPNRTHLAQFLAEELARAQTPVAVLFCDLDGFKAVNDSGGHTVGDQVLTVTGARLRAAVRPHDLVARVGGDEFVVVLHPNPDRDPRTDALRVADRISRVVAQPLTVAGNVYQVSVSTGITVADPGDDPGTTLHTADTAMYRAKALGKNRACEWVDITSPR